MFRTSFVEVNGYGSFFVVTFNFITFIQMFNFPFFLGTITMGDNRVASSIHWMNPAANNLSISCLTIIAYFGFYLYLA